MGPLVFLDFDDVLAVHRFHTGFRVIEAFSQGIAGDVPELWANVFDGRARRNLQTLHDEYQPDYIISSSWASYLDREQIAEVLKRTGLQFVEAGLHEQWCTPRDNTSSRLSEIESWLTLYAPDNERPYIIIDDHLSGGTLSSSRLVGRTVFCDAWVGFQHQKLRTARKILSCQITRINEKAR